MEVKIVKTRKSNNWYKNLEATLKLSVQFCHNLSDPSPIKLLGPKIGNGKLISASKLKDSIRLKKQSIFLGLRALRENSENSRTLDK